MSDTVTSKATVPTERAARYGKQLTSHLGRRAVATWDDEAGTGTLEMGDGKARATLTATDSALLFDLTASADDVEGFEDVIGRHLVRFGRRDELTVRWSRSDGTAGSTQINSGD